ncbi:hypothetical protein GCM10027418_06790 [Mariniluteicoccus endophyticus]
MLDTDTDGRLICHDCGKGVRHLATHARMAHGYATAEDYREAHGLARVVRLVSADASAAMSEAWEKGRSWREPLLAEVRTPGEATKASLGRPLRAGAIAGKSRAAASRRRDLTPEQAASLGDWYDIEGWVVRARRVMAETGLGAHAIARACGVSQGAVQGRLRRYPEK